MSKPREDLINEVANLLNIVGVGETVSAEDRVRIDGAIDPKFAELSRRRIVHVQDADDIDDEYFDSLASLVAESCGPAFGIPKNAAARLESEDRLREMQGDDWTQGDAVKAEYF